MKDALVDKHDADQPVLIVRVAEIVVLHDRSTSPYAIGCGVTLSEVTERLFVDPGPHLCVWICKATLMQCLQVCKRCSFCNSHKSCDADVTNASQSLKRLQRATLRNRRGPAFCWGTSPAKFCRTGCLRSHRQPYLIGEHITLSCPSDLPGCRTSCRWTPWLLAS